MIPGRFDYHRPRSVDEAVALLERAGPEARVLAGGHSLIPMMKLRLAEPSHLVDLQDVAALKRIEVAGDSIEIGAMTTQAELIASEVLGRKCPLLREAALMIADPQVRGCGTVGGNVANGDPGNDLPAVMMCLDASFVLRGPGGERVVAARQFYQGAFATALGAGEILTAVRVPMPPPNQGQAYVKMKRKVGDYATAAAAAALTLSGGKCTQAAIALTNVAMTPLYAEAAGQALVGGTLDAAAIDQAVARAVEIAEPVSDLRGPAEFRKHVAGVMTRRAIEAARDRAKGG